MELDRYTLLGFFAVIIVPATLVGGTVYALTNEPTKPKAIEAPSAVVSTAPVVEPVKLYDNMTDQEKFNYVIANDGNYSGSACEGLLKASAKFPTKIKMDWGAKINNTYWTDGDDKERGIITVVKNGEAMNGLGLMIPFTGKCEFAINLTTKKAVIKSVFFDGKKVL